MVPALLLTVITLLELLKKLKIEVPALLRFRSAHSKWVKINVGQTVIQHIIEIIVRDAQSKLNNFSHSVRKDMRAPRTNVSKWTEKWQFDVYINCNWSTVAVLSSLNIRQVFS